MSSTPISKIPLHQPNLHISGDSQEDDPEVQAILQEVQEKPIAPVQTHMYTLPPSVHPPVQMIPSSNRIHVEPQSWLQTELAKKALIASLIAGFLFHPKSMTLLYERIPILNRFESYDLFIRMALLAVVLYLFMWKLKL